MSRTLRSDFQEKLFADGNEYGRGYKLHKRATRDRSPRHKRGCIGCMKGTLVKRRYFSKPSRRKAKETIKEELSMMD